MRLNLSFSTAILIILSTQTSLTSSNGPFTSDQLTCLDPKIEDEIRFGLKVEQNFEKKFDSKTKKEWKEFGFNSMYRNFARKSCEPINPSQYPIIERGIMPQHLDHFNDSDPRKWNQHFLYTKEYAANNSINFLILGGEDIIGTGMLYIHSPHMVRAKEFGANVYVLEHRFYGNSQPSRLPEDLKYLSSRQALADAAAFVNAINEKNNISNPKWIVVGCSYAGNLAAWMRLKYPELVLGAVAHSAPVQAKMDFKGFLRMANIEFANCSNDVRRYYSKVQTLLPTKEGRKRLGMKGNDTFEFILCKLHSVMTCEEYKKLADDISKPNTTSVAYLGVTDNTNGSEIELCRNFYLDHFKNWWWQTLTEFGFFFYQTTVDGGILDDANLPVRGYINYLSRYFPNMHFNESVVQAAVDRTNEFYGGNENFNATNVIFINGSEDPWHYVSLYDTPNDSVKLILVQGTSHCADWLTEKDDDPEELKNARERTTLEIARWLGLNK